MDRQPRPNRLGQDLEPQIKAMFLNYGLLAVLAFIGTNEWLVFPVLFVFALIWRVLPSQDGIPILPVALSYHWLQVSAGLFYFPVFDRYSRITDESPYRAMVGLGLGCVLAIVFGLRNGIDFMRRGDHPDSSEKPLAMPDRSLLLMYVLVFVSTGFIQVIAWQRPSVTQILVQLTFVHIGFLFLVFNRCLERGNWLVFTSVLSVEFILGFTGVFANFRDPVIIAAIALFRVFERRRVLHWLSVCALAAVALVAAVFWTSVKEDYRFALAQDKLPTKMSRLSYLANRDFRHMEGWALMDMLVDRIWAIYYPALAYAHVPDDFPHTNGKYYMETLSHITRPRFLFREKSTLQSDSEKVRYYTGQDVAGAEENTSIAFGYAIEAYIDFGIPWMFLPVYGFGLFVGFFYQALARGLYHRDLTLGALMVISWYSLPLFERSTVRLWSYAIMNIVVTGGLAVLADQSLLRIRNVKSGKVPEREVTMEDAS